MKKILKFGSIGCIIFGLVLALLLFFVFLGGFSQIKLFSDAHGFKAFLNQLFYPTGLMILLIVFLFIGIATCFFMFDDDPVLVISVAELVSSVLFFVWFLTLATGGKAYFKRTIYGYDYKVNGFDNHAEGLKERAEKYETRVETSEKALKTAATTVEEAGGDVEKLTKIYNTMLKVNNKDASEDEIAYYESNADYLASFEAVYENYHNKLNSYNSTVKSYERAQNRYESAVKNNKKIIPLFILSFVPLIGGAAQFAWFMIDDEEL